MFKKAKTEKAKILIPHSSLLLLISLLLSRLWENQKLKPPVFMSLYLPVSVLTV